MPYNATLQHGLPNVRKACTAVTGISRTWFGSSNAHSSKQISVHKFWS